MIAKQSAAADCIILFWKLVLREIPAITYSPRLSAPLVTPLPVIYFKDSQKHQAIASKQGVVTYLLGGDLSSA